MNPWSSRSHGKFPETIGSEGAKRGDQSSKVVNHRLRKTSSQPVELRFQDLTSPGDRFCIAQTFEMLSLGQFLMGPAAYPRGSKYNHTEVSSPQGEKDEYTSILKVNFDFNSTPESQQFNLELNLIFQVSRRETVSSVIDKL